jgi:hypothetical protein
MRLDEIVNPVSPPIPFNFFTTVLVDDGTMSSPRDPGGTVRVLSPLAKVTVMGPPAGAVVLMIGAPGGV